MKLSVQERVCMVCANQSSVHIIADLGVRPPSKRWLCRRKRTHADLFGIAGQFLTYVTSDRQSSTEHRYVVQEFRKGRKQVYIMRGEWLCSQTSPCNELFVHREDDDRVRKKMEIVVFLRARSAQVPVVLTSGVSFQRPANTSGAIRWLVQA